MTQEWLKDAAATERNAIAAYKNMLMLTGDPEHIDTLRRIIQDEETHLLGLEGMRRRGMESNSPIADDFGCVFTDCLRHAIEGELDAQRIYRSAFMSGGGVFFFEAMADEFSHAILLNRMYTREMEKRLL